MAGLSRILGGVKKDGLFVHFPMSRFGRANIADMGHGGKVALDGFDMNSAGIGHHFSGDFRVLLNHAFNRIVN